MLNVIAWTIKLEQCYCSLDEIFNTKSEAIKYYVRKDKIFKQKQKPVLA